EFVQSGATAFPPPLRGGTGRGVATGTTRASHSQPKHDLPKLLFADSDRRQLCAGVTPSLSLPRKGGGNAVAWLCPSPVVPSHALSKIPTCSVFGRTRTR